MLAVEERSRQAVAIASGLSVMVSKSARGSRPLVMFDLLRSWDQPADRDDSVSQESSEPSREVRERAERDEHRGFVVLHLDHPLPSRERLSSRWLVASCCDAGSASEGMWR